MDERVSAARSHVSWKRVVWLVLIALVLLAVGMGRASLWTRWQGQSDSGQAIVLSGNIEAHTSVLSFKGVQSRITELPFDEGRSVKAGDVVAVLDSRELAQQVAMADAALAMQQSQMGASGKSIEAARKAVEVDRATLALRELELQRSRDLQGQGFVSDAVLDAARTAVTQARATLARDVALAQLAERNAQVVQAGSHSAEQALRLSLLQKGNAILTAPFDGVVVARQAELGEVVAPGTPVVTLADLDHVWLRAYLNETDMGRVRLGQSVSVHTDTYPAKPFTGRISFIASQAEFTPKSVETHAERVTLVYRVKIDLDNPSHWLLPGMPADARIEPVVVR
jgi:HlyD family secretion protein